MWGFPSVQEFIGSHGFQILITLLFLIFSAFGWASVYFSIKNNTKESSGEFVKNIAVGLVAFLVFSLSSCGLTVKYNETSKCRNLDLSRVKGVSVRKMNGERSSGSSFVVVIDDEKSVQEGLKLLRGAPNRHRDKDKFHNGYELQLILEDNRYSGFYIYYFSESQKYFSENSAVKKSDIIIPLCDAQPNESNTNGGGIYTSTFFGDWVRENIEPKFKNR